MKDTKAQLILRDGDFAIYKTTKAIMGGNYSVINFKDKTAKSSLSLDAAYDIFKSLTLKNTLRANKMAE